MDEKEMEDHDILIELKSEMKFIREDIKELKNGFAHRLEKVETELGQKLTKFEFGTFMSENHSPIVHDVDNLKKWRW